MIHTTIRFTKGSLICLSVAFFGMQLSACRGNNSNEPEPKEEHGSQSSDYEAVVEIGANILQSGDAAKGPHRVHLGHDNTNIAGGVTDILWTAGDSVACWNADEKLWAPYGLIGGANTTSARFQGKAVNKEDDEAGIGKPAMNINHAIFPLSATVKTVGTDGREQLISPGLFVHSIYFKMPGVQQYQEPMPDMAATPNYNPTFGTQYNVMTGTRNESDKNHIMFTSTGGVLLLRIKGSSMMSQIYALKLVSNIPGEKLWGTFSAAIGPNGRSTVEVATDINGEDLTTYHCVSGDNTLVLDCSTGSPKRPMTLPTDQFTNFYFVLPYGTLSGGFSIQIDKDGNDGYNDGTITTSKDNHIIQSDMKVMPALELTENVTLTWDLDDLYNQGTIKEF